MKKLLVLPCIIFSLSFGQYEKKSSSSSLFQELKNLATGSVEYYRDPSKKKITVTVYPTNNAECSGNYCDKNPQNEIGHLRVAPTTSINKVLRLLNNQLKCSSAKYYNPLSESYLEPSKEPITTIAEDDGEIILEITKCDSKTFLQKIFN